MDLPRHPISPNALYPKHLPVNLGCVVQTTAVIFKPLQTFAPLLLFISPPNIPSPLAVCDCPPVKFEHRADARRGKEAQIADIHYGLPPSFRVSLPNRLVDPSLWYYGNDMVIK